MASCNGCGSSDNSNGSTNYAASTNTENVAEARQEGGSKGYKDGYNDGYGWYEYGSSYNDANPYITSEAVSNYKSGYKKGYSQGYEEGQDAMKKEKQQERMRDPHNWESEDIEGFYIKLEGTTDEDEADFISRERYDGDYIYEWGDYYAEYSEAVSNGEYEITLGEKITSDLFRIQGSEIYIRFKFSTSLSSGDEGVLDAFAGHGTFYIKPD